MDAAGELVDIDMALPDGTYFCPSCRAELVQRRGGMKLHHFAHKMSDDCITGHEPMTEWHLNWQREFPESCREVTMDSGGIRHRADVVVGSIVLEFQHSKISDADWAGRTRFYTSDYEKRVFWVYDRTGHHVGDDLRLLDAVGNLSNTLSGCESLACREFARNVRQYGSDQPVFLDYGDFIVMCYNFLCDSSRHQADDKSLCYARDCVVLTRSGFVELIHTLGLYPWLIMQDFDMDFYVLDQELWFFDNLRAVAGACGHPVMRAAMDKFREYVVCRRRSVSSVGGFDVESLEYVNGNVQLVGYTMSLCEAWSACDRAFADSKSEYLTCHGPSSGRRGEVCRYQVQQVDVSMVCREVLRYL